MLYIDDLLGAELPSKAKSSFECMVKLLKDLNIPISMSKLTPPTKKNHLFGYWHRFSRATLSIPPPRLTEILEECVELKKRTLFTKVLGLVTIIWCIITNFSLEKCQNYTVLHT